MLTRPEHPISTSFRLEGALLLVSFVLNLHRVPVLTSDLRDIGFHGPIGESLALAARKFLRLCTDLWLKTVFWQIFLGLNLSLNTLPLVLLGVGVEVLALFDGTLFANLGSRALADVLPRGTTGHHLMLGHVGIKLVAPWHYLG